MSKYLLIISLLLCGALALSVRSCQSLRAERQRLEQNQGSLLNEATYYRTRDSLSAASVERLTLTASELRAHRSELVAVVESLEVKLRRVQSTSTTGITSNYAIAIPITSRKIKLDDETFDNASRKAMREALDNTSDQREIAYKTPYINIFGIIKNDSLSVDIQTFDTLTTIVHRVPRRFLGFIKYGTKAIRQEVTTANPNATIVYTQYIELRK